MKTYRVCILGCRARGTSAALAYHAHPRCDIVGLCDLLPERRDELGDRLGVAARFDDLDEMMQHIQPDIVAIPTGTEFHFELGMRVVEYGAHIDIEKPLCATLDQADALLVKAKEKGVQIAVHHQGRSGAALQAVSRALKAGKIGRLRQILGSGKGYYGGYGLMNIGTHSINAMLELTGPCSHVMADIRTNGVPIGPEDVLPSPSGMGIIAGEDITATMTFENRVTAILTQHRFPEMDSTAHGFEVFGTEGRLFWHNSGAWFKSTAHSHPGSPGADWETLPFVYPEHYHANNEAAADEYLYVDEYINALDEDRPHASSGQEGLHVMEIMMAIFESGAYRRAVALPQQDREHPLVKWRNDAGLGELVEMPRAYGAWLDVEGKRLGWNNLERQHRVKRI
ncbi:MAG: putative dehydrogenase [Candidatus Latescibacterota bacterium]